MRSRGSHPEWLFPLLSGVVSLAVYLFLAPPVSGAGDSSELTLVLAFDGVAHPTGYPLWTLLGHVFVRALHAVGLSWSNAANAWSALGGAAAIALLHAVARRLIPADRIAPGVAREALALGPPALLLLHPAWTAVTTVAEVYSWHQAWVMALSFAFLAILRVRSIRADAPSHGAPEAEATEPPSLLALAGWGALIGAGLAHHATSVLVSVPLSVALLAALSPSLTRRRGAGAIGSMAAAALAGLALPLASYAVLFAKLRHEGPAHWQALAPGVDGFWRHVTGAQYRAAIDGFALPAVDRQLLESSVYPLLAPALVLLAAAIFLTKRARVRLSLGAFLGAALLQVAFCLRYRVSDPASYFLPALGIGLLAIPSFVSSLAVRVRDPRLLILPAAVLIASATIVVGVPWTRTAAESRRALVGLDGLLRRMWAVIPYDRGIVLWRNDMAPRLREYQHFEGTKPGLEVWNPWMFTDPVVRGRFRARHGFDPLGDLALARADLLDVAGESAEARRFFASVAARINERTDLPVILFEPETPDVWVMKKPAEASNEQDRRSRALR